MAGPLFGGKQATPFKRGTKAPAPKGVVVGHPKGHGNQSFGARMAAARAATKKSPVGGGKTPAEQRMEQARGMAPKSHAEIHAERMRGVNPRTGD